MPVKPRSRIELGGSLFTLRHVDFNDGAFLDLYVFKRLEDPLSYFAAIVMRFV